MIEDRIPRAVCPLHDEYTFVGIVLSVSNVYDMTVDQFVGACMKASYGSMNPHRLTEIYDNLMTEAGLKRK